MQGGRLFLSKMVTRPERVNAELIRRIKADSASTFKRGASARQIAMTERALGVEFPPNYRLFLSHFNGGEFRFARMYKLSQGGAGSFDVRDELARVAELYAPFQDRALLPFGDDYSGNYYCLTLGSGKPEPPVVLVGRLLLENRKPKHVASDLEAFIRAGLADHEADD